MPDVASSIPSATDEAVLVEVVGHRMTLTLNRPDALNSLNLDLFERFIAVLERAQSDPEIRAVVVTGAGRAFCAGADLKAAGRGESMVPPSHPRGVMDLFIDKPVIAAVNGLAFGGGAELVLAADLAVAAESARFAFPEVKRGLIAAGGGAFRLAEQIPRKLAMKMLLTGTPIDANTALRWGLIDEVVGDGEALAAAQALADEICLNAPLAVQATKRIAYGYSRRSPEPWDAAGFARTAAETEINRQSEDALEGPRAFAEKREPVWRAR